MIATVSNPYKMIGIDLIGWNQHKMIAIVSNPSKMIGIDLNLQKYISTSKINWN